MRNPRPADGEQGASFLRGKQGGIGWVARETFFVGHQLNAVDSKGRVSVPAAFRTQLERRAQEDGKDAVKELMIAPSPKGDRLRAFDPAGVRDRTAKFSARVADLPAAEQGDAEEEAFRDEMATATPVAFDGAGRMVLPPILRKLGKIGDLAFFVGVKDYFEILSPEAARAAFANNPMMLGMLDHYLEERGA